jgi:glycosyltransferase involved in cell wall biosynthesis
MKRVASSCHNRNTSYAEAKSTQAGLKRLKIAQLIYSGLGGHGSVAFSLISADEAGSWQPIIGFFGIEAPTEAYLRFCRERAMPFAYFKVKPGRSWQVWGDMFRWLMASRPEAVILHGPTALLPCWIFARIARGRLIVVEHQANALKTPIEWLFTRLSMLFADGVVVLSSVYDQELKDRIGVFYRASKVSIIPNGVDTYRFRPRPRRSDDAIAMKLGMAARFTRIKRHDVLIEMARELRLRHPEIHWRLSLPGNGDTWKEVGADVDGKRLNSTIALPGYLDEEELIEWYQSLDIYVHASEGETLSTAILQAMASALPIVASDVPGIRNLICGETKCGLLIARQEPHGFAEAVTRLVKDPDFASGLGAAGRQAAERGYSHRQMFSMYQDVLRKK